MIAAWPSFALIAACELLHSGRSPGSMAVTSGGAASLSARGRTGEFATNGERPSAERRATGTQVSVSLDI